MSQQIKDKIMVSHGTTTHPLNAPCKSCDKVEKSFEKWKKENMPKQKTCLENWEVSPYTSEHLWKGGNHNEPSGHCLKCGKDYGEWKKQLDKKIPEHRFVEDDLLAKSSLDFSSKSDRESNKELFKLLCELFVAGMEFQVGRENKRPTIINQIKQFIHQLLAREIQKAKDQKDREYLIMFDQYCRDNCEAKSRRMGKPKIK